MLANSVGKPRRHHAGTADAWRLIHRNLPFFLMLEFSFSWFVVQSLYLH